ncbi:MAG: 2-oxoacid:ferredoxin oxidoreductase subunit beta, partial [Kiloniellales bacterium]|nr:2-oxoacid:ferredoxin oxidoreductase subunit beta [Kiloniellales bacterium]
TDVLKAARSHRGTSCVEIFQNCIVYNDGAFGHFTEREVAADRQIHLVQGEPMIFGVDRNKGLRLKSGQLALEVVTLGQDGISEADLLVHDEKNKLQAQLLAAMDSPDFPVALGVLYRAEAPTTYERRVHEEIEAAKSAKRASLADLFQSGLTWDNRRLE